MPQSFYFPTQGGMEYGRYSRGANPMDTSPRIPRSRATSTVLPLNGITGPTERELLQRLAITKSPDRHDILKTTLSKMTGARLITWIMTLHYSFPVPDARVLGWLFGEASPVPGS